MPQLLGIFYEIIMLALAYALFFKILDERTRYYLLHLSTLILLSEIFGSSVGLATYNQDMFSLYLARVPLIMPFTWFVYFGLSLMLTKGRLIYLKAFIAGMFFDSVIELPMIYNGAWSNNFGNIQIIEGYPLILLILYGFNVLWFKTLFDYLVPRLESRKIRSAGLLFAFVYIPSHLILSTLLVILIPI
ncbi:MAG: hypothetical protein QXP55_05865 [Nitrososphaerales archaeon]